MEVSELIKKSKTKSCNMDPIPTSILKQCLGALVGHIAAIINSSVNQSLFPSNLKKSMVIPSIKKNSLNPNEFSSYRPILNFQVIGLFRIYPSCLRLLKSLLQCN